MKRRAVRFCGGLVILAFVVGVAEAAKESAKVRNDESLRRGEARVTLEPSMFTDPRVREAYRIAKEIPWVLDSIYCYCKCEESPAFRHKSLLSCYVDNHAAM